MKIKQVINQLKSSEFTDKLSKDKLMDMAAALSYYSALSLAPLLIILIFGVSFLGEDFKNELIAQIQALVGKQAGETIGVIAKNADKTPTARNVAGIAGILTLLFSAGAIFGQLRASLNVIFETADQCEPKKEQKKSFLRSAYDFIKEKVFTMGMVLTFVLISVISLVASSAIAVIFQGGEAFLGQALAFLASQVVFSFVFGAIYYFVPEIKIKPKIAFVAGLVTAFLFTIGKHLIGIYLGQSATANMYGAAGSLILLLMWVFYSSLIIFISAEIANEINKIYLAETRGEVYGQAESHRDGRDLFH
ncbi:YihY/virulence factor BrkB family protein [Bdellovibrio reynosensis]|uniref:YihY/virulence factor BrkB family protein n=1 Tax=Bdellovibrio reynosensis TaxID=2835041 RepID=A0ABY4C796_9BACT|nr:YihY/virulence factor BrkB family protein [Bdellovibrio reynosensis]UOF00780.1 YihY/virulence factor BrkB family protein [Bdellovibrio reynosensis]